LIEGSQFISILRLLSVFCGFSFLLHFVWEMLQVPLCTGMLEMPHAQVVGLCTRATLGDVAIGLLAYLCGAVAQRDRLWMLRARAAGVSAYLLAGLAVTTVIEFAAIGPLQRWSYAPEMPIVPVLGIGLSALLQWLLCPRSRLGSPVVMSR
jgi:hypothetical protein